MIKLKIPAFILWLDCILFRNGHKFGRWWWADKPEATHQLCEHCAAMRKPKNRTSWFLRDQKNN